MKEAYAVRRTVPPSAEIEQQIDQLLAVGVGENPRESLSELARLGARRMSESPPRGRALSAARRRLPVGYTYVGMRTRLRVPVRTATARPPVSRTRPNAAAMPIPKSSHANGVDAEVEATGVDACSVLA